MSLNDDPAGLGRRNAALSSPRGARRLLLRCTAAVAAVGLAAGVTACGGSGNDKSSTQSSTSASPSASASASASASKEGQSSMAATDTPAPVQRALDAANNGDTDAFLAAFTADGAVDDWGREFRGRDAIRRWSDDEFIGKDVTLKVTGVRTQADTTTVSAQVGGKGFNGPSDFAFTVDGDRISLMRITG